MFIRFLGAIGTVTGTMTEMYHPQSGLRFLVDCGMMQGEAPENIPNWSEAPLPFKASEIDFVILTHAHLDHIGLIPRLIREGFCGEFWCTEATRDLTVLSLKDSLNIMKAADAEEIISRLRFNLPEIGFLGKKISISDGLTLCYLRNSHIVGACTVQVSWRQDNKWRSIAFSGDVGINREENAPLPLLAGQQVPYPADYTVLESTYGSRNREPMDRQQRIQGFRTLIRQVVQEKRIVILPCFAIQRGQEVLFDLYHALYEEKVSATIPLVVHSSMMQQANAILADHLCRTEFKPKSKKGSHPIRYLWMNLETSECLGIDPFVDKDDLKYVIETALVGASNVTAGSPRLERWESCWERRNNPSFDDAERLLREKGGFVVASAGMCDHGPVVEYLKRFLSDDSTTVALTGYCASGTFGETLLRVGQLNKVQRQDIPSAQTVKLVDGAELHLSDIRAEIFKMDFYSGHTDQEGLITWLTAPYARVHAREIIGLFLVHGTQEGREALRDEIEKRLKNDNLPGLATVRTVLPSNAEQWYDLAMNGRECQPPGQLGLMKSPIQASLKELVPFDFRVSPALEEAIIHDLPGPFRRLFEMAVTESEKRELEKYMEKAWMHGSTQILQMASEYGWSLGQLQSSPGELLLNAAHEKDLTHIEMLFHCYDFSAEELLEVFEIARNSQQWLLAKIILKKLKAQSYCSSEMSDVLATYITVHAPLTASDGEVFKLLLACGARADYVLPTGLSLLHLASLRMGTKTLLSLLIDAGADPSIVTADTKQTVLHMTAIGVGFNACEYWVEQGRKDYTLEERESSAVLMVDVVVRVVPGLIHERDVYGRTALHYASSLGAERLSLLFVNLAPELLSAEDNEGWCPVGLARCNGHLELADKLSELRERQFVEAEMLC